MTGTTSWPPDPADYEAHGFDPASTAIDCDRLEAVIARHALARPLCLDLACGTGRHARELVRRGHRVLGVDRAVDWLGHGAGLPAGADVGWVAGDLGRLPFADACVDLAFCLFNSLMEVTDNATALGLFTEMSRVLTDGGRLVIDNFCRAMWAEVADGYYATGVAPDGSSQMIFLPGENVFALRRGDEVRPDDWEVTADDRCYRLWSQSELQLAATAGGLVCLEDWPDFVFARRPAR